MRPFLLIWFALPLLVLYVFFRPDPSVFPSQLERDLSVVCPDSRTLSAAQRDHAERLQFFLQAQRKRLYEIDQLRFNRTRYPGPYARQMIQAFHEPMFQCDNVTMVGNWFDGGKYACDVHKIKAPCIVYSFGSNGDTTFEEDVHAKTPCEIHVFDPTLDEKKKAQVEKHKYLHLHLWGLKEFSGTYDFGKGPLPVLTLHDIMKKLGHKRIDILKIDIEESEWAAFPTFINPDMFHVGQIMVEVHVRLKNSNFYEPLYEFVRRMEDSNLFMFAEFENKIDNSCSDLSFVYYPMWDYGSGRKSLWPGI